MCGDEPVSYLPGPYAYPNDPGCLRTVFTLGPQGTSSHVVAKDLAAGYVRPFRVELCETYEEACNRALESPRQAVIVANAYSQINHFYISDNLLPIGAFFRTTPSYGIAVRAEQSNIEDLERTRLTVASHPAPRHLLWQLMPDKAFTVTETSSTSNAARLVAAGDVDACITNVEASQAYGLRVVSDLVPIRMLWTLFGPTRFFQI